jgi:glycosyltransferase involved in cell wall biosynthesis
MKKTSVLYLTLSSVRAGVEEHILTLMRGLNRELFDVHLAAPDRLLDALGRDVPSDVQVIPCNPDTRGWIREAVKLARAIRQRRIDVLHSHMFRSSAFASPVGRLCRVPLVVETSHGREAWRQGYLKRSYIIDRFVSRLVDWTIAVSEANARFLRDEKRINSRRVVVIHNGCDLARFRPGHTAPSDMRSNLGIQDGDPIVLVVGRLEPQKGHATLLDALPEVIAEFPRVRVICLGEGRLRSELMARAEELEVANNVLFVGFHKNVDDWLALSEFTVLPSLYEGLPLVAVESLGAGKPMVATAVEGTPEVIVHDKTGLLVPPGDRKALAEAVCRLLASRDLRSRLATGGRAWVQEHFSQEQQVLKTQDLYDWGLSENGIGFVSPKSSSSASQRRAGSASPAGLA